LPLRACLRHAPGAGLAVGDVGTAIVLPRRRRGRAYEFDERRFLTRQQLARLLAEIPQQWRPLFELLASTGLRISEAIGPRVMDARLKTDAMCVHVRRGIVSGQLTAPKSLHGRRTIPISRELAYPLRTLVAGRGETCAAMVIDAGASPLRLQRWMGHQSAAFTPDSYGHPLGDGLGPHLDVRFEMP
jgi:integrase